MCTHLNIVKQVRTCILPFLCGCVCIFIYTHIYTDAKKCCVLHKGHAQGVFVWEEARRKGCQLLAQESFTKFSSHRVWFRDLCQVLCNAPICWVFSTLAGSLGFSLEEQTKLGLSGVGQSLLVDGRSPGFSLSAYLKGGIRAALQGLH